MEGARKKGRCCCCCCDLFGFIFRMIYDLQQRLAEGRGEDEDIEEQEEDEDREEEEEEEEHVCSAIRKDLLLDR